MIGFLKPTAGTAYIQGMNILTEMDRIYACMGVCPQHEYVYPNLLFPSFLFSFHWDSILALGGGFGLQHWFFKSACMIGSNSVHVCNFTLVQNWALFTLRVEMSQCFFKELLKYTLNWLVLIIFHVVGFLFSFLKSAHVQEKTVKLSYKQDVVVCCAVCCGDNWPVGSTSYSMVAWRTWKAENSQM